MQGREIIYLTFCVRVSFDTGLSPPHSSDHSRECGGLSTSDIALGSFIPNYPQLSKMCNECHSPFHPGSRQNEIEPELLSQESAQAMLKEISQAFGAHILSCS